MSLNLFRSCENGATAIEYTLIAAGVSIAIAAAVFIFGEDLGALYGTISAAFAG
jgi:Flp pilus assembly pilin Flp